MKLVIKDRGPANYYDEFLYICFFIRKFIKNPNKKAYRITEYYIMCLILLLIGFLVMLFFYLKLHELFSFAVMIFEATVFLFELICLINVIRRIKNYRKKEGTVEIDITEKGLDYKIESLSIELEWKNIKYVIINRYTIIFLPVSNSYSVVALGIEYKDEVIKTLKKYNKKELLIDNWEKN